jgi:hypothetical protein
MNEIQFKLKRTQFVGLILNIIGIISVFIGLLAVGTSSFPERFENTPAATTGFYALNIAMVFLILGTIIMIYSTVKSQ